MAWLRQPSVPGLKTLADTLGIPREKAQAIRAVLRGVVRHREVEPALDAVSVILGGYEPETVRGDSWGKYWQDAVAAYVNMGDTYRPTIIYDIPAHRWYCMSVGDWVEWRERKYRLNPERKYRHRPVKPRRKVDPRSIRTVTVGRHRVRIGCPVGKWSPSRGRCKVGTRAVSVLSPKQNKRKGAAAVGRHAAVGGDSAKAANPTVGRAEAIEKAARVFSDFHGWDASRVDRREIPDTSVLVNLGKATGILYESDKFDGKKRKYVHHFGNPKPALCATVDRKGLMLVGGRINVKPEGITG